MNIKSKGSSKSRSYFSCFCNFSAYSVNAHPVLMVKFSILRSPLTNRLKTDNVTPVSLLILYCVALFNNHSLSVYFHIIVYLNINHMITPMKISHPINAFQSNLCFVILKFTFIFTYSMIQFW